MRRKETRGTRHKRVEGWGSGRDSKAVLAGWEQQGTGTRGTRSFERVMQRNHVGRSRLVTAEERGPREIRVKKAPLHNSPKNGEDTYLSFRIFY